MKGNGRVWIAIGIAWLLVLYLYLDGGFFARRFFAVAAQAGEILSWPDFIIKRSAYIWMHTVAIASLVLLIASKRFIAFIPILIIVYFSTAFDLTYYYVADRYPMVSDISVLAAAAGNLSDAISEYNSAVVKALIATTIFFLSIIVFALTLRQRKHYRWAGRLGILGILMLFGLHLGLSAVKGDTGLRGFPRGYSTLFARGELYLSDPSEFDTGFQYLRPVTPPISFEKIVVIMDESIVGSEFKSLARSTSIPNTYLYPSTTYSGANNSASSNFFFRKACYLNGSVTQVASLFEIAKKSGFRTIFIDNQNILKDPGARNYMTGNELTLVDEIITNYQEERFQRDPKSLEQLIEILGQPGKIFVYVNKLGAHVPYDITIPDGDRSGNRMADYQRSIEINSVDYLRQLAAALTDTTVVIYTSDHGQNFGKGPTHANIGDDAAVSEWDVPFAVSTGNRDILGKIKRLPLFTERYISHFGISELVRNLLGYSCSDFRTETSQVNLNPEVNSYCAHYGPPYSNFGGLSGSSSCRMLSIP